MHQSLPFLAGAMALALSTAANATIAIGANSAGSAIYNGPAPTYTFEGSASTPSISGGSVVSGTSSSHAQPLGSTGSYYSVGFADGTSGIIDLSSFGDITSVSLLWGSVDSYNQLQFLDAANNVLASFGGNDIRDPADGNQTDPNTNRLVTFVLTGADVSALTGLRLLSNNNAFEIDNLTIDPVPEPSSWALMLLGFAGVGLLLRARPRQLAQIA